MISFLKRSIAPVVAAFTVLIGAGVIATPRVAAAQGHAEQVQSRAADAPKIWEDRGPIQQLDLYWANGSADRAPAGPFTFVAEDLGGTNPKANVRDVHGVLWNVKWAEEKQAEVAATHLAWAMGLRVDETYYVDSATIVFPGGRPGFQRIGSYIDREGRLTAPARFKRWASDQTTRGEWRFARNPMTAEPGYAVLVLMDVIMANWDTKDSNTRLVTVSAPAGSTDWYMIGDYGACFGKMGGGMSHSKYRLRDFVANGPVIRSISGDSVNLDFKGTNAAAHASVPLAGARFFASRAADLTLAQVEDAFRAAKAGDPEMHGFAQAVYDRIREVVTKVQ